VLDTSWVWRVAGVVVGVGIIGVFLSYAVGETRLRAPGKKVRVVSDIEDPVIRDLIRSLAEDRLHMARAASGEQSDAKDGQ
jgi:hypothetical protein